MAAQTCPVCGSPVGPGERFCRTCGTSLSASAPGESGPTPSPTGGTYAAAPGAPMPAAAPPVTGAGFFQALFDLSFSEFITTRIIKVLYVLAIIGVGLFSLAIFLSFARAGVGGLIIGLIVAPLVFLLYVIFARVWLELVMIIFRIADYTRQIAQQGRGRHGG